MAIAVAGRRIDAPDAEAPRFPLQSVPAVTARVESLLKSVRPDVVVASAACGADLVALDAARRAGVRRRIVLPFPVPEFRKQSVVDRPGDWGPLYDAIVAEATRSGDLVMLGLSPDDDKAYEEANRVILAETLALPAPHAAAIIWEGSSRGPSDITAHLRLEAERLGFAIHEILTRE